jgi:hypothetical protein
MKAYGEVDVYIHVFLTSEVAGGELSTSRPSSHWIEGWVSPRAGLDGVEKILDPTGT